jgi:predicted dehydrogenase
MAPGRKNYNRVEINGSKGSLVFNFEEMNVLQFYNCADPPGRQGFKSIMATEGVHPYVGGWWPPGHVLGYEHTFVHAVYELMNAVGKSAPGSAGGSIMADFRDGAQCVAVLDAVEKSIDEGKWAKVETVD